MKHLLYFIAILALFASCASDTNKNNNDSASTEKTELKTDSVSTQENVAENNTELAEAFQKFVSSLQEFDYDPVFNMNFYDEENYVPVPENLLPLFTSDDSGVTYKVFGKITANDNLYLLPVSIKDSKQTHINLYVFTKDGQRIEDKRVAIITPEFEQVGFLFKDDLKLTISTTHLANKNAEPEIKKYQIEDNGKYTELKLPVTEEEKIADVISEGDLAFVKQAVADYNTIKSSKDIADLLNNKIEKVVSIVGRGIDKIRPYVEYNEEVAYFEKHIPIITVMNSDGGVYVEKNDYNLYKKALETPEKDDDAFFDAFTNGTEPQEFDDVFYLVAFSPSECADMETCYSLLGGGECYKALSKIQAALDTDGNFTQNLKQLKANLIKELSFYSTFAYSKEDVLKYHAKIIDDFDFSDEELELLTKIRKTIASAKDDDFNYRNK